MPGSRYLAIIERRLTVPQNYGTQAYFQEGNPRDQKTLPWFQVIVVMAPCVWEL